MISIIMPVYNCEKYINLSIESALNQSYKNIELILIDDGSTDNSGKICNKYATKDKRITVEHTTNKGPSSARNKGISLSSGSFIFFLDSDDFLEKDALKILFDGYQKSEADIIVGDFNKVVNDENVESGHSRFFSSDTLLQKQDIANYTRIYLRAPNKFPLLTQSWGKLFKSSIIKDNNILFNSNLKTFEDVAFNFDYLKYTNKIFFLNKVVYSLLIHTNHLSATMNMRKDPKSLFGYQEALLEVKRFFERCHPEIEIEKEIGQAYVCYTIIQLIRLSLQTNNDNKRQVYKFVRDVVDDSELKHSLKFYYPSKTDSKILPFLIKTKLPRLTIWACKKRATKRYKKK